MTRSVFCRGALLSLLLAAVCTADDDLVRRAADAVHQAFVAERWPDHESAFAEFHRVSMEHGAAPLSAETRQLARLVRVEHLICIAHERLELALLDEREEFGASVRALTDARQQLGAIANLDAATFQLLQTSIADVTTVIADATETRLRRELLEVDAALTAKRWDDCEPILVRLRPRPEQLKLDQGRVHRAEGFAQQIASLTWIVQAERELEYARTRPPTGYAGVPIRDRLKEEAAQHSRSTEVRQRLVGFVSGLDALELREPLEKLEVLVAALPPNGNANADEVQRRLRDVDRLVSRMLDGPDKSELAACVSRLKERHHFASLETALAAWAKFKMDRRFGHDNGFTAGRAQWWLSSAETRSALAIHGSNVQLSAAIVEATSVRDESGRRWVDEAGRRLAATDGLDQLLFDEINAASTFPGQPELLARALERRWKMEEERARRDREELAKRRAPPTHLRSFAWSLYGVLFVGCALLMCFQKPSPETVEPHTPSVLAALGRSVLALAICIGIGQFLVGYMVLLYRPASERTLAAFIRHIPVMTGLSTVVCAGVAYAFWLVGWGPEAPPRSDRLRTLQWFVVSALLTLGLAFGLSWGQEQLGYPIEEQEILVLALTKPTLSLYIALAFVVPIGEELLFRRLVYGQLRALGRERAVLISSALFAASHLNPFGFLVYMAIGVALCVAYEKTGRLAVPIAVHALYNLISITMQSPG